MSGRLTSSKHTNLRKTRKNQRKNIPISICYDEQIIRANVPNSILVEKTCDNSILGKDIICTVIGRHRSRFPNIRKSELVKVNVTKDMGIVIIEEYNRAMRSGVNVGNISLKNENGKLKATVCERRPPRLPGGR